MVLPDQLHPDLSRRVLSAFYKLRLYVWSFLVAQQDYVPMGVGTPVTKQVASGYQAIGIRNTDTMINKKI